MHKYRVKYIKGKAPCWILERLHPTKNLPMMFYMMLLVNPEIVQHRPLVYLTDLVLEGKWEHHGNAKIVSFKEIKNEN